jgi:hypothetical protein
MDRQLGDAKETVRFAVMDVLVSTHLETRVHPDKVDWLARQITAELLNPIYAWVWVVLAQERPKEE